MGRLMDGEGKKANEENRSDRESFRVIEQRRMAAQILADPELLMMHALSRRDVSPLSSLRRSVCTISLLMRIVRVYLGRGCILRVYYVALRRRRPPDIELLVGMVVDPFSIELRVLFIHRVRNKLGKWHGFQSRVPGPAGDGWRSEGFEIYEEASTAPSLSPIIYRVVRPPPGQASVSICMDTFSEGREDEAPKTRGIRTNASDVFNRRPRFMVYYTKYTYPHSLHQDKYLIHMHMISIHYPQAGTTTGSFLSYLHRCM